MTDASTCLPFNDVVFFNEACGFVESTIDPILSTDHICYI